MNTSSDNESRGEDSGVGPSTTSSCSSSGTCVFEDASPTGEEPEERIKNEEDICCGKIMIFIVSQ